MRIAVISDIHANLTALECVLSHCHNKYGDIHFIHLGDCIDYGMRPNEVIDKLSSVENKTLVNIKGNHERALLGYESNRFSSKRGLDANNFTKRILNESSMNFINHMLDKIVEINVDDKRILCVHGDLADIYWGKMTNEEIIRKEYLKYDFVLSGHTHVSSLRSIINKERAHKTLFINPGSIGQPRNLNSNAQYCVIDTITQSVDFCSLKYDIERESKLYTNEIDSYYRDRLYKGI